MRAWGGEEGMPSIPGIADLVEHINQGILMAGFGRNEEVDRCAGGRLAQDLPVRRDSIPRMFHVYVVPTWRECGQKRSRGMRARTESTEIRWD